MPNITNERVNMNAAVTQRLTAVTRRQPTVEEQKQLACSAGVALEMLADRLAANDGFAEEFIARPKSALGAAGIVLHKEGIEFLMTHDPARFDALTDKLFDVMDPNVINAEIGPSCDGVKAQ